MIHRLLRKWGFHHPNFRELNFSKLYGDHDPSYKDQHGVYRQIPKDDRLKRIVSIVRNPLQKYISSYVFGWWKDHLPFSLDQVKNEFPHFPDITFSEYYDLLNNPKVNEDRISIQGARTLGNYTRMFLVFYSIDPDSAASALLNGESLATIIPRITFLHQEQLRDNLYHFLQETGIAPSRAQRIYDLEDKNVGSGVEKYKISIDELRSVSKKIIRDERFFLEAFPEYSEQLAVFEKSNVNRILTSGCAQPRTLGRLISDQDELSALRNIP